MRKLEVIALNAKDARDAELAGADRIELVSEMAVGGLSPKLEVVCEVINSVTIPVNVMIRLTSDSFEYSENEMEALLGYLREVKKLGINGIVFGSLTAENKVDVQQLEQIKSEAKDLDVTYHRAIDQYDTTYEQNMELIDGKVTTVLTSGGMENSIVANIDRIYRMSYMDTRVLVGGGIDIENYKQLVDSLPNCDFHIGSLAYNNRDFTAGINSVKVSAIKEYITRKV